MKYKNLRSKTVFDICNDAAVIETGRNDAYGLDFFV